MADTDRELVSMAQQFSGLPMDSLIGAPLNAAAKGNASMALTQTSFLLDTCFNKTTSSGSGSGSGASVSYTPIMIEMSLSRPVIVQPDSGSGSGTGSGSGVTFNNVTTQFNLPLLTIIPINSLGVDNVDVTFEMEVKSSFSEDTNKTISNSTHAQASFEAKMGWGPFSATVKGSASYDHKDSETHSTHYQKSNSAKYTVNVHAGQLPVPKGVNTIIEAFTNAIQPIKVN
ncbi:DUF2589 domain-containing protein [bacterium SCSIO 12643]|nr:DUF2589 domain-containing protein [bacterium SCSIO 12643]